MSSYSGYSGIRLVLGSVVSAVSWGPCSTCWAVFVSFLVRDAWPRSLFVQFSRGASRMGFSPAQTGHTVVRNPVQVAEES